MTIPVSKRITDLWHFKLLILYLHLLIVEDIYKMISTFDISFRPPHTLPPSLTLSILQPPPLTNEVCDKWWKSWLVYKWQSFRIIRDFVPYFGNNIHRLKWLLSIYLKENESIKFIIKRKKTCYRVVFGFQYTSRIILVWSPFSDLNDLKRIRKKTNKGKLHFPCLP